MNRIVYKITFLKGTHKGYYYVGQHTTDNIEDNYLGSGKYPKRYFKKYGAILGETYLKDILTCVNSQEELDLAEKNYINTSDPLCMNIALGGNNNGGWNKGKHLTPEWKAKISASLKGHPGTKPRRKPKKILTEEDKNKHILERNLKLAELNRQKASDPIYRKHLSEGKKKLWQSEEYRDKMSERFSKGQQKYYQTLREQGKKKHFRIDPISGKRVAWYEELS